MIYLIGSLRNPEIPKIANTLRNQGGLEVFDDWYAAGPEADDKWKDYEQARGRTYREALQGAAAKNVYAFDRRHLEASDVVVLVLPAGRSGHLELGWALGQQKKGYILLDSPDRWDVMYQFATGVFYLVDDLIEELTKAPKVSFKLTETDLLNPVMLSIIDGYGKPVTPEDIEAARQLIKIATGEKE